MLARGVVRNEIHYDMNPSAVRLLDEVAEILVGAVVWIDVVVVGDVVPVIAHGSRDRHQPDAIGAEAGTAGRVSVVDIVETRGEPAQVSNPVAVGISEGADEYLVANAVAPPCRHSAWQTGPFRRKRAVGARDRE